MKYFFLIFLFLFCPAAYAKDNCNEALFHFENCSLSENSSGFFEYETDIIKSPFLFEELIPSLTANDSSFAFYVRVSSDAKKWSSWFFLGSYGEFGRPYLPRRTEDNFAKIKIDYLSSKKPLLYFQIKFISKTSLKIKLLSVALSSEKTDRNIKLYRKSVFASSYNNIDLKVPFRSQAWEDKSISGDICSPVSIGMVMNFYGVNAASDKIAKLVYDEKNDMYGIWWRSVFAASLYGFDGYVRYFRDFDDVGEYILKGIPVIACVRFEEDELSGSAVSMSEGHVVVISGFDSKGNPICRDCAWKSEKTGIVTYPREEFARAWFERGGGVGYIIKLAESFGQTETD